MSIYDSHRTPKYSSKTQLFGAEVEAWVLDKLIVMGYTARPHPHWVDQFDILITGPGPFSLLVEVKAARQTWRKVREGYYRPRWQFDTADLVRADHIIVLVAQDNKGGRHPFVCPSWLLWQRRQVQLTSHPVAYAQGRGMFASFLGRWEGTINQVRSVIAGRPERQRRYLQAAQLPLDGFTEVV